MKAEEVINDLKQSGELSAETVLQIEEDRDLRFDLIHYFEINKNREVALKLLKTLRGFRQSNQIEISGDILMLACYIVGKHNHVEDCLEVWKTKKIDYDTYSYIDIQLLPFSGVSETISYLRTQASEEAKQALAYVIECLEAGDFDNLEQYYTETPWFV